MSKSFIRGIWGIYDNSGDRMLRQRKKIDNDIWLASLNPYEQKPEVYVFGEENYKYIIDKGFSAKLIDQMKLAMRILQVDY